MFQKKCIICSKNKIVNKVKLNNGNFICRDCLQLTGISDNWTISVLKACSREQIMDRILQVNKERKEVMKKQNDFTPTVTYKYAWFDDCHKWLAILKNPSVQTLNSSYIINYDDIINFEILAEQNEIEKDILYESKYAKPIFELPSTMWKLANQESDMICNRLDIKITTKNPNHPYIYIQMLTTKCYKNSQEYYEKQIIVEKITSKLQAIMYEKISRS